MLGVVVPEDAPADHLFIARHSHWLPRPKAGLEAADFEVPDGASARDRVQRPRPPPRAAAASAKHSMPAAAAIGADRVGGGVRFPAE